jgi:hypothetical protein
MPDDKRRAERAATQLYLDNRAEADEGAVVSWVYRYNKDTFPDGFPHEVSALQAAYNILIDDGQETFASEMQGDPEEVRPAGQLLTRDLLAARCNGRARGEILKTAEVITAQIDVHDEVLYWIVCAWNKSDFSGAVIDYGTWPAQRRQYFTLRDAGDTLSARYPGAGPDGAILAGLRELIPILSASRFGPGLAIEAGGVDSGYKPETVTQALIAGGHDRLWRLTRGMGIGAAARPFEEYDRNKCRVYGTHYWIPSDSATQTVNIDVNWWKDRVQAALATAPGDPGALTLCGTAEEAALLIQHLLSEFPIPVEGRGRHLNEWRLKATEDNHWWDTLIGAMVHASRMGCTSLSMPMVTARRRPQVVSFAAMAGRR